MAEVTDATREQLLDGYIEWTLENCTDMDAVLNWARLSYESMSNEQVSSMLQEYEYPPEDYEQGGPT